VFKGRGGGVTSSKNFFMTGSYEISEPSSTKTEKNGGSGVVLTRYQLRLQKKVTNLGFSPNIKVKSEMVVQFKV
jgi:hypothetical protein